MNFGSDPELEGRIGRACLVFARVEQEAGHVLQAADGDWDLAGSPAYLNYSSVSRRLVKRLKAVADNYPEVQTEVSHLCQGLRDLKAIRDQWAHSAAVTDLFLLLREQGATSVELPSLGVSGRLLNSKTAGHSDPPTDDLNAFVAAASDVGDTAMILSRKVAQTVIATGVRTGNQPQP